MSKKCEVCGAPMEFEHKRPFQGSTLDVYVCSSSNMYPWECYKCGCKFHLNESYPTSQTEYCPKCNQDSIANCHCNL